MTILRKAQLIESVRSSNRLLPDVLNEYDMSIEEWLNMCSKYDAKGARGMLVSCPVHRLRNAMSLGSVRKNKEAKP